MFVEHSSHGFSAQVLRPVYDMLSYRPEILQALQTRFSLPSQQQIADEQIRIGADQLRPLFEELITKYGYRDIGLSTGSNLSAGCFGSFSYLLMSADTLRQSLDDFCQYHTAIADMPRPPRWSEEGDEFYLELFPIRGDGKDTLIALDLTLAASYRLLQHAAPADFALSRVHICGDGGGYRGRYRDCFATSQLVFSCDSMRLYADSRFLDAPLPNSNRTLQRVFRKELTLLLSELNADEDIIGRIHRVLCRCDNVAKASLRDIAAQLGISERSLTRQLSEFKLSFRELLSNFKSSRSVRLLAEGHSVDEVCYYLGFSERAAFDRAFKKWQGITASRFQEEFRCSGANPGELFSPEQLPTLPHVAQQLLDLIEADNCDMGELAKVVEQDPGLTAKLMALANSAMYGAVHSASIKESIIKVFGSERLRNLALAMLANDCFDTARCEAFSLQHYWTVALGTGQLAAELAKSCPTTDPEQAYLFGLLHDIGTLLLVQQRSQAMAKILARPDSQGLRMRDVCSLQRQLMGVDSCSVGAMLAAFWNLPKFLSSGIRSLSGELANGEDTALVQLVAASEYSVRQLLSHHADLTGVAEELTPLCDLSEAEILQRLQKFAEHLDNLKAAAAGLL